MEAATILIVDDEQKYLDLITDTLRYKNYNVLQALNGKMGCMVAERFLPDIIITDWEMPVMSGIEMIIYLKNQELTKQIPIIMATAIMTSAENLETALNAGASDYIRKPIDPIELIAIINSAFNLARSNKEIINQRDKLIELNATKNKFFSIISHDLKGPVGYMVSLLDYIKDENLTISNEQYKQYFTSFNLALQGTFDLLNNLLTWARSQMGELEFEPMKLKIHELVQSNVLLFKPIAEKKNIKLYNDIQENLFVFFDFNMIDTVFRNLINNAIKYSIENGQINIEVKEKNNEFILSVKDNGIGMSKTTTDKLFRIDNKITSKEGTKGEKGTGLGLILCKEFVEKHGGKIWAESDEGKGSTFKFTLPKVFND